MGQATRRSLQFIVNNRVLYFFLSFFYCGKLMPLQHEPLRKTGIDRLREIKKLEKIYKHFQSCNLTLKLRNLQEKGKRKSGVHQFDF